MIVIIGRGNVAVHFYQALKNKTEVVMVNPHTLEGLHKNPDIILISVTDDSIPEVFEKLPATDSIVAHTSGSIPMDVLKKSPNHGVFYPLQTFTKEAKLDYSEIPVFIEGNNPFTIENLKKLASLFTDKIYEADTELRGKLHLASVFACNFTNALAGISEKLLKDTGLDFKVLLPLMKETLKKLETIPPRDAQTGPAKRGDRTVMQKHIEMLGDYPHLQKIYTLLSDYITSQRNEI